MTALMEAATEHDCRCGARPARVWVQVAEDAEPMCRACARRASSDPVFLAGLVEAYREPVEDVLPPLRASKPVPARRSEAGQALARRVAADPELRLVYIELGRRVAAIRRRCLGPGCDLVTNAGGLALHQRFVNHHGYEESR